MNRIRITITREECRNILISKFYQDTKDTVWAHFNDLEIDIVD